MDAVTVKELAQNARPAHIARQHDHAVSEIPIVRNVVRRGLAAAAVRGSCFAVRLTSVRASMGLRPSCSPSANTMGQAWTLRIMSENGS